MEGGSEGHQASHTEISKIRIFMKNGFGVNPAGYQSKYYYLMKADKLHCEEVFCCRPGAVIITANYMLCSF
jgi:hypothetical protein